MRGQHLDVPDAHWELEHTQTRGASEWTRSPQILGGVKTRRAHQSQGCGSNVETCQPRSVRGRPLVGAISRGSTVTRSLNQRQF